MWFESAGSAYTLPYHNLLNVWATKLQIKENSLVTDYHILELGNYLETTDPRDHIYGLLGLASTSIIPDYAKDDVQVCHDFVRNMLRDTGRAEWLRYSGVGNLSETQRCHLGCQTSRECP
jgi:hypothetical protein